MDAVRMPVITHIRRWLAQAPSDVALLRRFTDDRDETAFAELVDRHGPMVLGVACRVLGDRHGAEDVLQATFLTLARRAKSLRSPEALPSWLHQTARHFAATEARARRRRQRLESNATERMPERDPLAALSARELLTVVDEELQRLPVIYRLPLLLCCFEGQSQEQAAATLGWSPGSVRGRLERGRQQLRNRLARRGLTFAQGAGIVSALVAPQALAASVRNSVLSVAINNAVVPPAVALLLKTSSSGRFALSFRGIMGLSLFGVAGLALLMMQAFQVPSTSAEPPIVNSDPPAAQPKTDPEVLPEGAVTRLGASPLRIGSASVTISTDGKKVIALSSAGVLHTFAAEDGRLMERRPLSDRHDQDPILYNSLLSENATVAAISDSSNLGMRVTVWDLTTGRKRLQVAEYSPQLRALSHDGNSVAIDVFDREKSRNMLRVYDLTTGKSKDVCEANPNLIARFSPDGKRLIGRTINDKNQLVVVCFDVRAGKNLWEAAMGGSEWGMSHDGRVVFAADRNAPNQLRALDADTGRSASGFKLPTQSELIGRPVGVPGGRTMLIPLKSGEVSVWDYQEGRELKRLRASVDGGVDWELGSIAVSPDGKTAITNVDGLRRWDLSTGEQLFGPKGDAGHIGAVQTMAFINGGKELVSVGNDSNLIRWDATTGQRLGKKVRVSGMDLWNTRRGVRIGNAEWSRLTVSDPFTGKSVERLQFADNRIPRTPDQQWRYALLDDGRTLLTYSPENGKAVVAVRDCATSKSSSQSTIPPPQGWTQFQAFSPCGRWCVAYGEVYEVATGDKLWTPSVDNKKKLSPLLSVTFSPDGRLLCGRVRSVDDPIDLDECVVWEVASGAVVARLTTKHVGQIAFSPDNRIMASVTAWGLHLVDLTTSKQIAAYESPDVYCNSSVMSEIRTLIFSPDGRTVATGHHNGSIQIWKAPPRAEAKLTDADLATAWSNLGGMDCKKSRAALHQFTLDPSAATTFLEAKLRAADAPAGVEIPKLIKELDSPRFAVRDQASRKLQAHGFQAESALREALKTAQPEMTERISQLLDRLAKSQRIPVSDETLRGVRALELLEKLEIPNAKKLLKSWAAQFADPRLATEARLSLERKTK